MKRSFITAGFVIAVAVALSACAQTHLRAPLPDYQKPDAATLYIQRPSGMMGAASANHVVLDGKTLGVIGPGQYWIMRVRPGKHVIGAYSASRPVVLAPGSTTCMTIKYGYQGTAVVFPSDKCPPPNNWDLTAKSSSITHQ